MITESVTRIKSLKPMRIIRRQRNLSGFHGRIYSISNKEAVKINIRCEIHLVWHRRKISLRIFRRQIRPVRHHLYWSRSQPCSSSQHVVTPIRNIGSLDMTPFHNIICSCLDFCQSNFNFCLYGARKVLNRRLFAFICAKLVLFQLTVMWWHWMYQA